MIDDIRKKKIGRELREWIFLGVRTGMRRAAEKYEEQKYLNYEQALLELKRGVSLPRRAKIRILSYIQAKDGNLQLLRECLELCGSVTISEIQDELEILIPYAAKLREDCMAKIIDFDEVSIRLREDIPKESLDWIFPIPDDYDDEWGE